MPGGTAPREWGGRRRGFSPHPKNAAQCPRTGLDIRLRFKHPCSGDAIDLLPQPVGGIGEQLAVILLHPGGVGRRQGPAPRDDQRFSTQDHAHRLRPVARPLLLKRVCRPAICCALVARDLSIGFLPATVTAPHHRRRTKKPTWLDTLGCSATSAYSLTGPPALPSCPLPSHPTSSISLYSSPQGRQAQFRSSPGIMFSRAPGQR